MFEELSRLYESDMYPFHMPGHKRRMEGFNPYSIDITEIDGFDDMHAPKGIIRELNDALRDRFGGEKAYILVNGSTSGVLTAISSCVQPGERLLLAGNSHKSAFDAVYLRGLEVTYIYPEKISGYDIYGGIDPEVIERELSKDGSIRAVFITSPTYEGFLSNVREIAGICHDHGIPLITDSAHGAHSGLYKPFTEEFGLENAAEMGADIVIKSLHKTLPAFTQTSLIHLNGDLVDEERFKRFYSAYQTTSPSYILMAGADRMLEKIEKDGDTLFKELYDSLRDLRNSFENAGKIRIFGPEYIGRFSVTGYDPTKILISSVDMTGKQLYDELRLRYGLQPERAGEKHVLLMTSMMDEKDGFIRLKKALNEMGSTG